MIEELRMIVQLVVGLYLVAGFRLDVWNLRLLWCIPVSVFLFSVFYSVSAVAGLRWRSPILAIALTTIFGTICLVVGKRLRWNRSPCLQAFTRNCCDRREKAKARGSV